MIQQALAQLLDGEDLSRADAREVMDQIMRATRRVSGSTAS